ncbi:MAG: VWA domain-containing protein [Lachnospiraceae bacterium]|nr:VWA domain-containing protein [Lachnospiraceae bacterium]
MKKTTWKKIVSFILVAALVISVGHFGGTKVKADTNPSVAPTEHGSEFAPGSGNGDLTPAIQYEVEHTPGEVTSKNQVNVIFALDISSSMVKNNEKNENIGVTTGRWPNQTTTYDKEKSRLLIATDATELFVQSLNDEYCTVQVIGFNDQIHTPDGTPSEQIASLYNTASSGTTGTNIPAAVNDAVDLLKDEDGNLKSNPVIVILSDGEPYVNYSDAKKPTQDALDAARQLGIKVYAVNFTFTSATFDGHVDAKLEANGSTDLNNALEALATQINSIYANAWIEATLGKYITYTGNAAGVAVKDGKLTWVIPAPTAVVNEDQSITINTVIPSDPIQFAVKIGDYVASDTMDEATKNEIVKLLLDNQNDPEITVTTDEQGNTTIQVNVTATANLYYSYGDFTSSPIPVGTQQTATVYVGSVPTEEWIVNYVVDGTTYPEVDRVNVTYGTQYNSYNAPATPAKVAAIENPEKYEWVDTQYNQNEKKVYVYYEEPTMYTVKFFVDDKEIEAERLTVREGSSVEVLPEVAKYQKDKYEDAERTIEYTISDWDKTVDDLSEISGPIEVKAYNKPTETLRKYTLTINYVKENGETVDTKIVPDVEFGSTYGPYETPEIKNYKADIEVVKGTMPAENVSVTVTYYENSKVKVIYYVDDAPVDSVAVYPGETVELIDSKKYQKADTEDATKKTTYAITGWSFEDGTAVEKIENITEDVKVYAVNNLTDELKSYKVTVKYV